MTSSRAFKRHAFYILDLASSSRSDDPVNWHLIAHLDQSLAQNLEEQGKPAEAHPLHRDSLIYWDKILRWHPHDLVAMYRRIDALRSLATFLDRQGNTKESLIRWEQAVIAGEELVNILSKSDRRLPDDQVPALARLVERTGDHSRAQNLARNQREMLHRRTLQLMQAQTALADLVRRLGDHERAKRILEASLRMLENLSTSNMTPLSTDKLAVIRKELALVSLSDMDLSHEAWSRATADFLSSTWIATPSDAIRDSEAGYRVAVLLSNQGSLQRRLGKLGDAQGTADRLLAFGRLLVTRYPDQSSAHLALAEAYAQFYKNAWQSDDRVAVERNLRLSLDTTRRALALDPKNEIARDLSDQRQRRLNDLLAPEPEPEVPDRPVRTASQARP